MSVSIADWLTALFFVAALYLLVRPNSAGTDMIKSFSDAMVAMVRTATDI